MSDLPRLPLAEGGADVFTAHGFRVEFFHRGGYKAQAYNNEPELSFRFGERFYQDSQNWHNNLRI